MTTGCLVDWPEIGRLAGPCIRPGGTELTSKALEVCGLLPGSRIVDIGCGEGGTLEHLAGCHDCYAAGLDCSEILLRQAASRLSPQRLVLGRAEALPFRTGCLDALFCECVLSVLPERAAALREFARVLKDGGYLVLSDVFDRGEAGREGAEEEPGALPGDGFFTKGQLFGVLDALGFSSLLWEEHQRSLKEFAARMILAGAALQDFWCGGQGPRGMKVDRVKISYFLMVASKTRDFPQQ
jgi:SAM-dependent methyltransferase